MIDTSQLSLFIRGVSSDFEVTKKLVSVNSVHGTNTKNSSGSTIWNGKTEVHYS